MLKRSWTYRRKRTEASFRGFENSRNVEVPHHEHDHEPRTLHTFILHPLSFILLSAEHAHAQITNPVVLGTAIPALLAAHGFFTVA